MCSLVPDLPYGEMIVSSPMFTNRRDPYWGHHESECDLVSICFKIAESGSSWSRQFGCYVYREVA